MSGIYDDRQAMTPGDRERFNATLKDLRETIAAAPAPQAEGTSLDNDNDPEGDGKIAIWRYINNHEDMLFQIFTRLEKLEGAAPAETAGEMTAEQFHRNKYGHTLVHPIEAYEFAEAFAKQRVEQQPNHLTAAVNRELRDLREKWNAAEAKVADLERERDTARETSKELNRRNGALQHTLNTLTDRNVWYGYYKAAISLFGWEEDKRKAAESELREMREALGKAKGLLQETINR